MCANMPADALRMDGEDLGPLLCDIEAGFAVALPRDLRHVVTAGDLADEVWRLGPEERAGVCPTQRVFYRLRDILTPFGMPADARPSFHLSNCDGAPKELHAVIVAATGWHVPALAIGWVGCSAWILGAVVSLAAVVAGIYAVIPAVLVTGYMVARSFDRPVWAVTSLGALARRIAARNHAALVADGARHARATTWHAIRDRLAEVHGRAPTDIGRASRLFREQGERR